MSRSPCHFYPFNQTSTNLARFPLSVIHPGDIPIITIDAFNISEVAERRAAFANAVLQDLDNTGMELLNLFALQVSTMSLGVDFTEKERFIGVDVADACDQSLI